MDAERATIRSLAIYSFSNGQIRIAGTGSSEIERSYIGTPDGGRFEHGHSAVRGHLR